jgi:TolB-like protein/tetratricopeptide (TPR) repeat protein
MAGSPDKLTRFWNELKRRKVIRVISVYAAAAFVILELVDIVSPSLRLPEWTMNLVIVLLSVGFIIAVIISWIYDIHPEEGIVKTKPAQNLKEEKPAVSNSWKIASYISFVVIVVLIVINIIPGKREKQNVILDKSIAVLPFMNDSPEETEMYFINGTMEAILDHLCKIKDLRVVSRTSTEQYRNNPKPVPVVAKEMNVSYILEGSGLKHGNQVRLTIQLIDALNDKHLWSETYDRPTTEIFELQSEVAQLVAREIQAVITPREKELIEKVPTSDLTAYDYYQRGYENLMVWWMNEDTLALTQAEDLFQKALEYDPAYAKAYAELAWVYFAKHNSLKDYLSEQWGDSLLFYADIALQFDNQLAEAYDVKGNYYYIIGDTDKAFASERKAIEFNPNYWEAYWSLGDWYYSDEKSDSALLYFNKAIMLNRGSSLPILLGEAAAAYSVFGFRANAYEKYTQAFELEGDSGRYCRDLGLMEQDQGNWAKAVDFYGSALKAYPYEYNLEGRLGYCYFFLGNYQKSMEYYRRYYKNLQEKEGELDRNAHRLAYAYWKNGHKKEAEYYFDESIRINKRLNELGRIWSDLKYTYYSLAAIHAFRGEKEKAYENLRIFNRKTVMPLCMVRIIKVDPLFSSIRDEPEFEQIVRDVEAKYRGEHERLKQWLAGHEML